MGNKPAGPPPTAHAGPVQTEQPPKHMQPQYKLNLAFYEAVLYGRPELVLDLLRQGAQPISEADSSNPSHQLDVYNAAAKRAGRVSSVDMEQMTERIAKIVREGLTGCSVLPAGVLRIIEEYCLFDRLGCLRMLYQERFPRVPGLRSPLFDALELCDSQAVELILQFEPAAVFERVQEGYSPNNTLSPLRFCLNRAQWAREESFCRPDPLRCVRLLLDAKADVNEPSVLEDVFRWPSSVVVIKEITDRGTHTFTEEGFNPLARVVTTTDLCESDKIAIVQHLSSLGLLKKEYGDLTSYLNNPMCAPRQRPSTAVQLAEEHNNKQLAELLRKLL